MILSGHQPCYLPGLQFFNKVMHSDAFMYVPHCQYQAKSWHSHNYICTSKLIVPTHSTLGNSLFEVTIDYSETWQRKHLRAIELAYSKTPFFKQYYEELSLLLNNKYGSLAELNIALTDWLAEELNCGPYDKCFYTQTPDLAQYADPVDMLIAMCKSVGCDEYLSNQGAKVYITPAAEARMGEAGIRHRWLKFTDPDYGQGSVDINGERLVDVNGGRFSGLDILFTRGPGAAKIIKEAGSIA